VYFFAPGHCLILLVMRVYEYLLIQTTEIDDFDKGASPCCVVQSFFILLPAPDNYPLIHIDKKA
jgi:hypothetical protein